MKIIFGCLAIAFGEFDLQAEREGGGEVEGQLSRQEYNRVEEEMHKIPMAPGDLVGGATLAEFHPIIDSCPSIG